ncbi:MAG TPA: hypothetical protein H9889_06515, partial [Candidatus Ignatzschineria merdigallinarum]|nr:hypothetical protein [Candidatus Ignatzschineria merdigallinarum]
MIDDFKNTQTLNDKNDDGMRSEAGIEVPYGLREIQAVAVMEGCFPEKFGIPRQAGIAKSARGTIRLLAPFNHENYL